MTSEPDKHLRYEPMSKKDKGAQPQQEFEAVIAEAHRARRGHKHPRGKK